MTFPSEKKMTQGSVRVPAAPVDPPCPKCDAWNATDRQHHVWRVADERGFHFECNVCGHDWGFQP